MEYTIEQLTHTLRERGEDWADKNAAADLLEETKHSVLSQCMSLYHEDSNAAAEAKARRDVKYIDHIKGMVEARKEANKAKVRFDSLKAYIELFRTREATKRAEANIR